MLSIQHQATVTQRPFRPAFNLFSDKPVFHFQLIMRKLVPVKQMPESLIDFFIPVVTDLDLTIFNPKISPQLSPNLQPRILGGQSVRSLPLNRDTHSPAGIQIQQLQQWASRRPAER